MRYVVLAYFWLFVCRATLAIPDGAAVAVSADASRLEVLAAREIRRYTYVRTGTLLPVVALEASAPRGWQGVLVARKDRLVLSSVCDDPAVLDAVAGLQSADHWLKTVSRDGRRIVLVVGGSDVSTLYAAYRLAERLGVRFYLHGDVVPDETVELAWPALDERCSPHFSLRGIQPFHDFPEGPDWWNVDDYKAVLAQLPKLRMNFFGLHTYPEGHPNAEPTVWIGPPEEVGEGAGVRASYPSSYQNTLRGNWGYEARRTGDFAFGADRLFERDDFGSNVMLDASPQPESPQECNGVFQRTAEMLGEAFWYARGLGVKTCVGTETPLTVPKRLQDRLQAAGKDPKDPAVIRDLYAGIFLRAARAYPLDYYWFWTPEGWTWQGATSDLVQSTIADLRLAIDAWRSSGVPFRLATCGWVLGPQDDRALFDKLLPPGVAVSCINRAVGNEPVDPSFERVGDRPKWAIPWLEDDPGLTMPQLWVGRMRRDAADARRYGCTGLMGIHWRTRILGPNVLALSWAAWEQDSWNRDPTRSAPAERTEGPEGGQHAAFPSNPIEGTDDDPLYQTVRYDVRAYRFRLPNDVYRVTLRFCEPHYGEVGQRVFGVKLEEGVVIENLDIFQKVGKNRALDFSFDAVDVSDGWMDIELVRGVEFPSIAAIEVAGPGIVQKINCGGKVYEDYAADWPPSSTSTATPPTADFYEDWAASQFGCSVGPELAELFARLDGSLPRPADWVNGPGGIRPDPRSWDEVVEEYEFVEELAAFRDRISGAGSLERFDYWLDNFRHLRAMGKIRCIWARLEAILKEVEAEKDAARKRVLAREKALPVRRELVAATAEAYRWLLGTVSNPGELGTVANWEQHILPSLLDRPGTTLAEALGEALPLDALPSPTYEGPDRLIVPTVRSSVDEGEPLTLKVLVLTRSPHRGGALYWRPMGEGEYRRVPLKPVARGVHTATLPEAASRGLGIEYSVEVLRDGAPPLRFPATAPEHAQTVVVAPPPERRF